MDQALISGRYRAETVIGAGAAGTVYSGVDTLTGEQIAIKILRADLIASMPELLDRFYREGEALRRLNHPNIVKVLTTVNENNQHYIIMEYIGGGSLAELIKKQHQLAVEQVISLGIELSDALARAHYLGIIHRDLKPGNILIDENGSPRLSDFGLAWVTGMPAITTSGSILGTFPYLSPEACSNQALDPRTDIWSLGIILYEMLTGCLPFSGESPFDIIWTIKNNPLPEMSDFREGIPAALEDLIATMLKKDAAARPSSARQVGAQLESIQRKLKGNRPPEMMPGQQKNSDRIQASGTASPKKIQILIVDDHAVVRQGLRAFIDLQEDMQVVAEGADGFEAVSLSKQYQPDLVLLDLVMPGMDGIEATKGVLEANPKSRVIILTSFGEDDKILPAIRAGAQGYLLKDIQPNELIQALREAHAGKTQLHPDIARKLMTMVAGDDRSAAGSPARTAVESLTERELDVLRCVADGLSNREIAEKMVISETTVKTHVSHILGKLGLEDRTQAAIWALKHGFGTES